MSTVVLTVVAAKVAGSETNFPAYIKPSVITGLGTISLADAQSSRIYADVTKLVEQAREVVSADEIHTKIAALTTLSECYFDYDGIRSDYSVTDTYGRNAVWATNYKGVWHLASNETDSHGSNDLTNTNVTYTTGKIGDAAVYNSSTDYLRRASDSDFNFAVGNAFSISGWVYLNNRPGNQVFFSHQVNDSTLRGYALFITPNGNVEMKVWDTVAGGKYFGRYTLTNSISASGWYYIVGTYDGSGSNSGIKLYVSASNITGTGYAAGTVTTITNTGGVTLGNANSGGVTYNFDGNIDSARVQAGALSANWITTEYNNQNDNAAFWTASGGGGSTYRFVPQLRPFGGL